MKDDINTDSYFKLAYRCCKQLLDANSDLNNELPENKTVNDILITNKSISVILVHKSIKCPSIEVCLDLVIDDYPLSIGYYRLIIDNKDEFVDEYLVFN